RAEKEILSKNGDEAEHAIGTGIAIMSSGLSHFCLSSFAFREKRVAKARPRPFAGTCPNTQKP
ncbi:MAG TPA: hypothetical protein VGO45_09950, partial [Bacteroidia bacterium]|nr:hypothetical protein [Bacteroidia bacterium]